MPLHRRLDPLGRQHLRELRADDVLAEPLLLEQFEVLERGARVGEVLEVRRARPVLEVGEVRDERRVREELLRGEVVEVEGVREGLDKLCV